MSKLYIIYGDYSYKDDICPQRCDYKVFALQSADSPNEAFLDWLREQGNDADLFEDQVIIREVSETKAYQYICDYHESSESDD